MILRFILGLVILLLGLFLRPEFLCAQEEQPSLAGKAICTTRGKAPFKKFVAEQNRILLFQGENGAFGSIQLQAVFSSTEKFLLDVNILAIFEQVKNLTSFLNGKTQAFDNSDSEMTIKRIDKSDQLTTTVSNTFTNSSMSLINGKINLVSHDNLASGRIRLGFLNSTIKVSSGLSETIESNENNGPIIINCRFKGIPVEVRDLPSNNNE
jgi:hypothetical protein